MDERQADMGVRWIFTLIHLLFALVFWLALLLRAGTPIYVGALYGVLVLFHLRWLVRALGGKRVLLLLGLACTAPLIGPLFYMAFSVAILWRQFVSY